MQQGAACALGVQRQRGEAGHCADALAGEVVAVVKVVKDGRGLHAAGEGEAVAVAEVGGGPRTGHVCAGLRGDLNAPGYRLPIAAGLTLQLAELEAVGCAVALRVREDDASQGYLLLHEEGGERRSRIVLRGPVAPERACR